jgi:hypothetical protein
MDWAMHIASSQADVRHGLFDVLVVLLVTREKKKQV